MGFAFVVLVGSVSPHLAQAAFLAVFATSLWLFWSTLNRRLFSLFPKPWDLPPGVTANRLWRVFREVILQSRVMRDRPLAGILHALVVWGFIAFVWVSAEHIWAGLRGLEHAHAPSWYNDFVAVWAFAVLIGILGLLFRRFVLRPKALGELSATSAAVGTLIVVLMVTYLLGWRTFAVGSMAWKANWWIHTLAFCAMLVVIPQSKHLHLVLAPFAVFFRPETTSAMRPLREDVDDDFGLIRFKDLSWKDVLDVNSCVECGRCTDFCPANITGGSLNPKHITLNLQHGLLNSGEIIAGSAAQKSEGSVWIAEDDLFQCLSCGACEEVCPVGIEHVGRKILDLRRGLVSEGRITNEKVVQLFTAMERAPHNPWGISQDTRQKFIEAKGFPIFDGSQEFLFWMGCGVSFDAHGQAVASAMKRILDAAGVSWGVLARESCCGEPARRGGNEYLYLQLAEQVTESFKSHGVKKVISCCPHCTTMFDKDYRQIASYATLDITVTHHTEAIAQLFPKLPLQPLSQTVTYHDPCYLARHRGVTEAPREILWQCGVSIAEMPLHGKSTFCCGAGGAQIFIADDRRDERAERVNRSRFAQALSTGASTIAVSCPYCPTMFQDAAGHAQRDDIAILDVAEIVATRLAEVVMSGIKVISEADVIEIDGEIFHHHPNGGGLVSKTAHVAATAYIGPEVIVAGRANVLDRVRLEGFVRVRGDVVLKDDVCARDRVRFEGSSQISQQAKFSDDVRVSGNSQIAGDVWICGNIRTTGKTKLSGTGRLSGSKLLHNQQIVLPANARPESSQETAARARDAVAGQK